MTEVKQHWVEKLRDGYENGYSDVEVCKEIGITTQAFEQMMKENPQFKRLVEYGRTLAQAWWVTHARKSLFNKSFNHQLWAFVMKNRFGWADRSAAEAEVPMTQRSVEELREQVARILPKLNKQFSPEYTDADLLTKSDPGK